MPRTAPSNLRRLLGWATAFAVVLALQLPAIDDSAPAVNDAMEVFDLGWNLGRGYGFDWDDPAFRHVWEAHNGDGRLDRMLAHHGGWHPTMSRPPLMPVLVGAVLRVRPNDPFRAWRAVDAAGFAAAVTLLAWGVRRRLGPVAAVVVFAVAVLDPLRRAYVPGWWTEGLAFDGVAALAALVLVGPSRRVTVGVGGVVLGLLCLDRSSFVLLMPVVAGVLAMTTDGWRRRTIVAVGVLVVAAAVQVPWWARNVAVSGRFLPLGTQAGMNLPDEYGDRAVIERGLWTGEGMARVWAAEPGRSADDPAMLALWPTRPVYAALIDAETCRSLATEVAVADAGQRAGVDWLARHPAEVPGLFAWKVWRETDYDRPWAAALLVAGAVGLVVRRDRRLWTLAILSAGYVAGIGLTHAVQGRFAVPILPAVYPVAAAGLTAGVRRVRGTSSRPRAAVTSPSPRPPRPAGRRTRP